MDPDLHSFALLDTDLHSICGSGSRRENVEGKIWNNLVYCKKLSKIAFRTSSMAYNFLSILFCLNSLFLSNLLCLFNSLFLSNLLCLFNSLFWAIFYVFSVFNSLFLSNLLCLFNSLFLAIFMSFQLFIFEQSFMSFNSLFLSNLLCQFLTLYF